MNDSVKVIIKHTGDLPVKVTACDAVVRIIERWRNNWSVSLVTVNPMTVRPLPRLHKESHEVYAFVRGCADFWLEDQNNQTAVKIVRQMVAGNATEVPIGAPHFVRNRTIEPVAYLAFSIPPLADDDVCFTGYRAEQLSVPTGLHFLLQVQVLFDGAHGIVYDYPQMEFSLFYSRLSRQTNTDGLPYHCESLTEFTYIISGSGVLVTDDRDYDVVAGDWLRIDPGVVHHLINKQVEDLVFVRVFSPMFCPDDIIMRT